MTQVPAVQQSSLQTMSRDQINLIKRTVAKGADDDELALFLHYCSTNGFDPLNRDVYFRKNRSKNGDATISFVTAIDTLRSRAEATGQYAGNDDPVFDNEQEIKKASVTVWKLVGGLRCPFTATARWDQYYPGDTQGFMWRKMPHLMLGKCAEALALRKAFPKQLAKLYAHEEMHQADKFDSTEQNQEVANAAQERLTAPVQKATQPAAPVVDAEPEDSQPAVEAPNGDYVIKIGKNKGKALQDVSLDTHLNLVKWLVGQEKINKKPIDGPAKEYLEKVNPYVRHFRTDADIPF